ncbi:MAG: hypothetical protein Kow0047_33200 [Anaerolineae bacterium]
MARASDFEKIRKPLTQPLPEISPKIVLLNRMVQELPQEAQERFRRIFHVSEAIGRLDAPESMYPWIRGYFGSLEVVTQQKIVKVTNLVTMEGALFNELRARRPIEARDNHRWVEEVRSQDGDPFCHPEAGTPEDIFGRVRGEHCITASNIAKYDGMHGLIIFREHDPLAFGEEQVVDYITTAERWAEEALICDPDSRYFFFMWNCLWKAAASILHGHAQVTMTRDMHYARVEGWRRAAERYRQEHGSDYFEDLYQAHADLGLAFESRGVRVISYLTPTKERETLLMAPSLTDELKRALYRALSCFRDRMAVMSFNVALYLPPLGPVPEDWSGFPAIFRLVDRGDPVNRTADIGAMELYAANVIGTDPFYVAEQMREVFDAEGRG